MKNSQVLEIVNDLIVEECGRKVTLDSMLSDADMDDLGTIVFAVALDDQFPGVLTQVDPDMSVRDLVHICRLSLLEE